MAPIFHILSRAELEGARAAGRLAPPSLGAEGFVHASFRDQVVGVADRFFAGRDDLVLVELDPAEAGRIVVETPPGEADAFPHVYGAIPAAAIRAVHDLPRRADGGFTLPDGLRAAAAADARAVERLLAAYAWYDHPEGPKFVETHRDPHRTSGHWLFLPGATSAFHRVLDSEELWLAHQGRLIVHVIDPDGGHRAHLLGPDPAGDARPVLAVPVGWWQAAELAPGEPFAFGANVCAPGFSFERFELAARDALVAAFPAHRALIERLTHAPG